MCFFITEKEVSVVVIIAMHEKTETYDVIYRYVSQRPVL